MRILFLSLGAAFSLVATAQVFDLGLKGGVNADDLSSSYPHSALVGGNVGLFVRVKPLDVLGAQGEVLLSSMGTHVRVAGLSADLRTATLQLPLFLVVVAGPAELHLGGYYDRQLAKVWDLSTDLDIDGSTVQVSDLRDGSFGLLFGAGVHLHHFHGGARYDLGLQSVGTGPYLSEVKNRQVQIYLGWGFF